MSDTINNSTENKSNTPSLLDGFDDADFDTLWDSSLGQAGQSAQSDAEPAQTQASKLGGLDINWGSLGAGDLNFADDFENSDLGRKSGDSGLGSKNAPAARAQDISAREGAFGDFGDNETRKMQMTPEMFESLRALREQTIAQKAAEKKDAQTSDISIDTDDFLDPEVPKSDETDRSGGFAPSEIAPGSDGGEKNAPSEKTSAIGIKSETGAESNDGGGADAAEKSDDAFEFDLELDIETDGGADLRSESEESSEISDKFEDSCADGDKPENSGINGDKPEVSSDSGDKSDAETDSAADKDEQNADAETEAASDDSKKTEISADGGDKSEVSADGGDKSEVSADSGKKTYGETDFAAAKSDQNADAETDSAADASGKSSKGELTTADIVKRALDASLADTAVDEAIKGVLASDETAAGGDQKSGNQETGARAEVNSFEAIESFDEKCRENCLSERARMGRVMPEGEVVSAEHEINPDEIYPDEACAADGFAPSANQRVKKLLVVLVALMVCVLALVIAYAVKTVSDDHRVKYAQKASFRLASGDFDHFYATRNGNFKTACSNARGVVLDQNNALAAEYWPDMNGCLAPRISEDGRIAWFVDARHNLNEIKLESENGFAPRKIAHLNGYAGKGFDVGSDGKIRWIARNDADQSLVLRSQPIAGGNIADEPLPPGASVCDGFFGTRYAYVSGDSIHIAREDKSVSASLAAPKLGCSDKTFIACAYDGQSNWSVLCQNSIRQGSDDKVRQPVRFENTRIRSGASHFNLIRHEDGTDLIAASEWIRIDAGGKDSKVLFKQDLGKSFAFARSDDEKTPLRGIAGRRFKEIAADGEIIDNYPDSGLIHLGNAFVNGGSYAVSFFGDPRENVSKAVVWDINSGRLVDVKDFPGRIRGLHIAENGRLGFAVTDAPKRQLTWISFQTNEVLGAEDIAGDIDRVEWSDDGVYALLHFASGSSKLFEHGQNGMTLKREYGKETVVALGHNGLMWRISGENVMFERIDTGSLSVINEQLSTALRGQNIKAVLRHPGSDDVLFWGDGGLWNYSVSRRQLNNIVIGEPILWAVPDRRGRWLATSAGIVDMTTLSVAPYPTDVAPQSLDWLGSTGYALDRSRKTVYDFDGKAVVRRQSEAVLPFIGGGMDLHPTQNFILENRGDLTMLSSVSDNRSSARQSFGETPLAVMGGTDVNAWCWRAAKGNAVQGSGAACASFERLADGTPAPIPLNDPKIAKMMQSAFAQDDVAAHMYAPYVFVDDVDLTIETVPAQASVIFVVNEGTLPPQLASESGFLPAPIKTTLKRADVNIGMAVTAPSYELRALSFAPNTAKKSFRIPLLRSDAADISVSAVEFDEENRPVAVDLSDNIRFELANLIHENRDAVNACLAAQNTRSFSLWLDENGTISAKSQADAQPDACLAPIAEKIEEQRKNGALPDLTELSVPELRFGIAIPQG